MRVSNAFWLNGPDPDAMKLFWTFEFVGVGKSFMIATACGDSLETGIRFPANGVRPAPVSWLPVAGSYTCPPPFATPSHSLKSQNPVAAVQVLTIRLVGMVSEFVCPTVCRVPW